MVVMYILCINKISTYDHPACSSLKFIIFVRMRNPSVNLNLHISIELKKKKDKTYAIIFYLVILDLFHEESKCIEALVIYLYLW